MVNWWISSEYKNLRNWQNSLLYLHTAEQRKMGLACILKIMQVSQFPFHLAFVFPFLKYCSLAKRKNAFLTKFIEKVSHGKLPTLILFYQFIRSVFKGYSPWTLAFYLCDLWYNLRLESKHMLDAIYTLNNTSTNYNTNTYPWEVGKILELNCKNIIQ